MEKVETVREYCGWRMYEGTYQALMAAKRTAKPVAQTQAVRESQTAKGGVVAAQAVKEDPTNKLFNILTSDGYSAPRVELTQEASEQLYSAVMGSEDYRPVPKRVQEQN